MARVLDVLDAIEKIAPERTAFGFDKVGLQVGNREAGVTRAVVSLDRSLGAVRRAKELKAELLLAHHPLIWEPLQKVVSNDYGGHAVLELARSNIAFIAAHTNWDCALGGVNDALAQLIGLRNVRGFGEFAPSKVFRVTVFVPEDSTQRLIDAMSGAGAGTVGRYDRCAYFTSGTGTFRPKEGAKPTIGEAGKVEEVSETKLEMLVPAHAVDTVWRALVKAHPYEEPAYDFTALRELEGQPAGRIGELPEPVPFDQLIAMLDKALSTKSMGWGLSGTVRRVAVVGGSASNEWRSARDAGADVLVTGEAPQHVALEASESGMRIVAAGHYATEQPGCAALARAMGTLLPEIEWSLYEPAPGESGRPL